MTRAGRYLGLMTLCMAAASLLLTLHPRLSASKYESIQNQRRQLVTDLRLTDLCLFTEARYTRHLSQADLHSAFQEHPLALEHFPSGSMLLPPPMLQNPWPRLPAEAPPPPDPEP
jgi:hypothetical protein